MQKDGSSGKGMQNLTARYNYIYNANILLDEYVSELHETFQNNYNELLPVHLSPQKFKPTTLPPTSDDKSLDEIINKSRTIITDKSLSNYLDEAYLLMGKAQFYKGNFFLAAEYFAYVAKTYPENQVSLIQALDWHARALMQINDLKSAASTLDSLEKHLQTVKKKPAEPLATLAQFAVDLSKPQEAIAYLQAAIKESKLKRNTIRWHFILGQLFQRQKDYTNAAAHYKKVQSSNIGFALYFNAKLNMIDINARLNGSQIEREEQLLALLKDEKNEEFSDQIYYQIAEYFRQKAAYEQAIEYYNKAVAAGTTNQIIKGMAFLQLAELSLNPKRDYLQAKKFYDLALQNLSEEYPGFEMIRKKSESLDYLSSRFEMIAREDSLQLLATLPESEREIRARQMLFPVSLDTSATVYAITAPQEVNAELRPRTGTFYFQNQNAVERGYADFIKRWGNRKLEDNWRQSVRSTALNTQETLNLDPITQTVNGGNPIDSKSDSLELSDYLNSVPINSQMMLASNERIVNAYLELASFYQQELKDRQEAARIYEIVLKKFPSNSQLASINYSLYLIYNNLNEEQAARYKHEVLTNHASSIYARVILEPSFSIDQNLQELEAGNTYNELFEIYQEKDFLKVISLADQMLHKMPETKMAPQFAYLRAIALGHTAPVDSLIKQFQKIKATYPQDKLIVPLINEHLSYINQHMMEFKRRSIALIDFDPNETRFIAQKPASTQKFEPEFAALQTPTADKQPQTEQQTPLAKTGPFSNAPSTTWYFVVDVEDASIRLSTSRFGIGQFSRGNYPESDLRHQLVEFDNDQLIYVGNFSNFEAAKAFQDRITPQLNRIMRIRPTLYKTFIISKENFEIVKSKSLLNQYLNFYKNTY